MKVVSYSISGGSVLLNAKDVKTVSVVKWYKVKSKNTYYALGTIKRNGKRASVTMHNYLLGCPKNPVDHKDRNGLNNVRKNLRIITHFENLQNHPGKHRTSKFKGVSLFYRKSKQKEVLWRATISSKHLGLFKNEIEAAKTYDKAAAQRFGPAAFQNTAEYGL